MTLSAPAPAALLFMATTSPSKRGTGGNYRDTVSRIKTQLDDFRKAGWRLGVEDMLNGGAARGVACFDASWADGSLLFGIIEAPNLSAAVAGLAELDNAGWSSVLRTQWIVGIRDLPAVPGERSRGVPSQIGFLALWNWNDGWHRATQAERRSYDAECDVAFEYDRRSGINMSGRHVSAWSSEWDNFSVWEVPGIEVVDRAMRVHERVKDFMFTTSRHVIGIKCDLLTILESIQHG
jgi:hypothetical protein